MSRDIEITLLTAETAQELRLEAQAVLGSLRRRQTCQCDRPWRSVGDLGFCGRCGKWRENPATAARLLDAIDSLAEFQDHATVLDTERRVRARLADEGTVLHMDPSYAERQAA